jgi:hypothetical protein
MSAKEGFEWLTGIERQIGHSHFGPLRSQTKGKLSLVVLGFRHLEYAHTE